MNLTLDTTLGTILDEPKAKELLDKHFPGASSNPLIGMARGMSLKMIVSMPQAAQMGFTKEKAEALLAEINKLV